MTSDDRLTRGLTTDVSDVLERQVSGMVPDLAYVCAGARDTSCEPYHQPAPPAPPAGPAPPGPDADAATLDGEVRTVPAAMDIAADFKRDRAAACAGCGDPSRLTCQSRLQNARACAQTLQTAAAATTAKSGRPEPDTPPTLPTGPHLEADRKAAQ
jgi:predicted pyridoxine 5'-phosphate oxidase superfamily flavin-nucleotide-binding protein